MIKPRWLTTMFPGKTGRDHLGLGSVSSNEILPMLAPSINVLTFHPRYHSFYAFLLDEFWRQDLPRNHQSWVAFFRPRDLIYSIGCNLCEMPEHGDMKNIVGSTVTDTLASEQRESFPTDIDYIKTRLGGYGLYYRTVMEELGIIFRGGRGYRYQIDVPSEEIGKPLAQQFRSAIQNTEYYKNFFNQTQSEVPLQVVREYIHKGCLCQLKKETAPDRGLLRKVFLSKSNTSSPNGFRRETIRYFLDIADSTVNMPVSQDDFRRLIYFRTAPDASTYTPNAELKSIHDRWRLYQAREYYSYALNSIWSHICDWGLMNNGDHQPIHIDDIFSHIQNELNFGRFSQKLNLTDPGITIESRFIDLVNWIYQCNETDEQSFDHINSMEKPLNEDRLYYLANRNKSDSDYMLTGMFVQLCISFLRFRKSDLRSLPCWRIAEMGWNGRLSFSRFITEIEKLLSNNETTVLDVAENLIQKYIIQQHIVTATRKMPDNTFRFRFEGSRRLRFFSHWNSLNFMDSRFNSISTTIYELGLCGDLQLENHPLTEDGEKLLLEDSVNG